MVTSDSSDVGLGNFGFGIGGWQPCKNMGPGGGQDHEKASKRPPQSNSKWEQITKRCQGTSGTGDRTGVKRDTSSQRERRQKGGGSLRHTPCSIFKVMLFISSESVSPAVPDLCAVHYIWPERLPRNRRSGNSRSRTCCISVASGA